jgi:predicted Zn-dependent peptidase
VVVQERTASWMSVTASYDADKALDGVATVLDAIRRVREGQITDLDVAVARETMLASWRMQMATAAGAASQYAGAVALGIGVDSVRDFPERLARVGRGEVVRVAGQYMGARATHVLFMGDDRWLDVSGLRMGEPTVLDLRQ